MATFDYFFIYYISAYLLTQSCTETQIQTLREGKREGKREGGREGGREGQRRKSREGRRDKEALYFFRQSSFHALARSLSFLPLLTRSLAAQLGSLETLKHVRPLLHPTLHLFGLTALFPLSINRLALCTPLAATAIFVDPAASTMTNTSTILKPKFPASALARSLHPPPCPFIPAHLLMLGFISIVQREHLNRKSSGMS